MAATSTAARLLQRLATLLGGVLAAGGARAVDLPTDRAEAMFHSYSGGGVTANGPALLVRKSVMDKVSLSASYFVDAVSNASIDVVTTASPYKETRHEFGVSADYVYKFLKTLFDHREEYYSIHPGAKDLTPETALKGLSVPLHPGAEKYFKETGIMKK